MFATISLQEGKDRSYRLGLWTRQRYDGLVNNRPYSSELLNVISTTSERAILTGQLFLAGFYPPTSDKKEKWNPDLLWQPIPVYPNNRVSFFPKEGFCGDGSDFFNKSEYLYTKWNFYN